MSRRLGVFNLSNSKRLFNKNLFAIDGFKDKKVYYTENDSFYIRKGQFWRKKC